MSPFDLIVIGGSAGSFEALNIILPALTPEAPPVLVVLHLRPDRPSSISELFADRCTVRTREAEDKEPLQSGTVYFAPPNYHLMVSREGWISLSIDPLVNFSRPSIDVLFESAAVFGSGVLGIILSGANEDGAAGLSAIAAAGGKALVQDPQSAISREMPAAALTRCPGAAAMGLDEIAGFLRHCAVSPESAKRKMI
jgi:two-component system chemotaxis response regulator CheB